jgi:hypothetical protein
MSSIRPRSSQRNAHRHSPSTSTDRATPHRTASIHRRRRPRLSRKIDRFEPPCTLKTRASEDRLWTVHLMVCAGATKFPEFWGHVKKAWLPTRRPHQAPKVVGGWGRRFSPSRRPHALLLAARPHFCHDRRQQLGCVGVPPRELPLHKLLERCCRRCVESAEAVSTRPLTPSWRRFTGAAVSPRWPPLFEIHKSSSIRCRRAVTRRTRAQPERRPALIRAARAAVLYYLANHSFCDPRHSTTRNLKLV